MEPAKRPTLRPTYVRRLWFRTACNGCDAARMRSRAVVPVRSLLVWPQREPLTSRGPARDTGDAKRPHPSESTPGRIQSPFAPSSDPPSRGGVWRFLCGDEADDGACPEYARMSKMQTSRPPFLRTRRNQPLNPNRLLQPIADALQQFAELAQAVSDVVDDARWPEAAEAFERAAGCLKQAQRPRGKEQV